MAAKARLETVLTGDDTPFVQAVERAERRAQTFQSRVTQLFRRTPERRAEVALGGFVSDLTSGNVTSAITGIASRMSGLGLALGVGAAGGIALYESFKKASMAAGELEERVGKLTQGTGPASYNSLDELMARSQAIAESKSAVIKSLKSYGPGDALADLFNPENAGSSPLDNIRRGQAAREKMFDDLQKSGFDTQSKIAQKAEALVNIRELGLKVSERSAELAKIEADYEEKKGKALQAGPNQNPALVRQLTRGRNLEIEATNKRFDLAEQEAAMEERIQFLSFGTLTAAEKRTQTIRERIGFLKQEIAVESDPIKRHKLSNKIGAAQFEEAAEEYKMRSEPAAAIFAERAKAKNFDYFMRHRSKFGSRSRHLDMSGNEIPNPAYEGPGASPEAYDLAPAGGRPYERPLFSSNLGDLSKHMTSYAGSDYFSSIFGGQVAKGDQASNQSTTEGKGDYSELVGAIKELSGKMDTYWR
jgi:hypothetical protein